MNRTKWSDTNNIKQKKISGNLVTMLMFVYTYIPANVLKIIWFFFFYQHFPAILNSTVQVHENILSFSKELNSQLQYCVRMWLKYHKIVSLK